MELHHLQARKDIHIIKCCHQLKAMSLEPVIGDFHIFLLCTLCNQHHKHGELKVRSGTVYKVQNNNRAFGISSKELQ
jgi:hypothetical protein